jgi:hypothetical protein
MRILIACLMAVMASGCAAHSKKREGLPKALDPLTDSSKVDDTFRGTLHSNEPNNDPY